MAPEFYPGTLVNVLPNAFAFGTDLYLSSAKDWCLGVVIAATEEAGKMRGRHVVKVMLLVDHVLMTAYIDPVLELGDTWKAV